MYINKQAKENTNGRFEHRKKERKNSQTALVCIYLI